MAPETFEVRYTVLYPIGSMGMVYLPIFTYMNG